MEGLFGSNGILTKALTRLADLFCLSLLWLICCIPIFTIGAANTALYYSVNKAVRLDGGGIWSSYWSSFKSNFKKSTIMWIAVLLVMVLLVGNCYSAYLMYSAGSCTAIIMVIPIVPLLVVALTLCFIFPYIARVDDSIKQTLKNCFGIAFSNFGSSIILCIGFLVAVFGSLIIPIGLTLIPAGYALFCCSIVEKILSKLLGQEPDEAP